MTMFPVVITDGGRADAGFKGETRDCVTRAIAVATGRPYAEVYAKVNEMAREERPRKRQRRRSSARTGVYKDTTQAVMAEYGFLWHPTMGVGTGCRVHARPDELPQGVTMVLKLSRHLCAVKDGAIWDAFDPTRGGTRCVYGYWTLP